MGRFVKNVCFFLLIIATLGVATELFVRHIPNSYRYKDNWIKVNGSAVKTLVLGNSTIDNALSPSLLDSAFTFANSDQLLEYDDFILDKYSKYCPNLKNVILPLDYGNLFSEPYEERDGYQWYRAIYYQVYLDYKKHPIISKYNLEIANPLSARNKALQYIESLLYNKDIAYYCDSLGRTTQGRYDWKKEITDQDVARYAGGVVSKEYYEYNKGHVISIAKTCQEKGVRLILTTCPKWCLCVNALNQERIDSIRSFASQITNTFDNCYYKSYLKDSCFIYKRSFFRDETHMSENGCYYFTKRLLEDFEL